MINKHEPTVAYIINLLNYCDGDALINMMVNIEGKEYILPVQAVLIHENDDKRELVSFLYEEEVIEND